MKKEDNMENPIDMFCYKDSFFRNEFYFVKKKSIQDKLLTSTLCHV